MTFIRTDAASQPIEANTFDLITCADSLSYFDKQKIVSKVIRLLKPGRKFIAVASLNHNPLYLLNRYIHFLRGKKNMEYIAKYAFLATISFFEKPNLKMYALNI